ncbi:type II toxin-antitoxin system VapB family antitoxin [Microbacterium elymi]|uniref:Type II toxin-antitoxin system VapB family antitoxin n=1 Tax=Microbacterium elymi TaxID=2909587 RepID=A0ABY5NH19_9MICO|nr:MULTISPECIES: type II toxin-antitoxin system VapB family antitoxin [Microbacterium]UUT34448.1 type II toxin-antitoxin system VapB family antitoxin [Microbacterium elymi]
MSLNIKNDEVHAAVRELSRRLGVNQTSAVEIAVRAKLAELGDEQQRVDRARRIRAAAEAGRMAFRDVDLRAAA